MRLLITAFLSGLIFALGLGLAGMTDPANVQGFLDVAGDWDYRLAFVMGGAIAVHAALRPLILRRGRPLFAPRFPDLLRGRPDAKLLAGSALFGVGWGLGGYCPGPALTSVASGAPQVLVFVAAMFGGFLLARLPWARGSAGARSPGSTTAEPLSSP
ncbi:DUF6691 family protein [Myxococcus sp. AB025B]|uniref:DUF6691 family protein n=1 Tax=Myxococcus sp. AB025B TaxID=2562794 RepID=UPI0011437F92|nr:DUF6691 family protein [Myxococcus sp. AB025B]